MVAKTAQKIIISGYYGFKNSGDEAVLTSILYALEEAGQAAGIQITPVVLSIDPEWTTKTYGVEAVHRMKLGDVKKAIQQSDGLISGGGSLLQDVTGLGTIPYYLGVIKLAQWLGKPTFIYAQGVGPVQRGFFHPFIKSVMKKCKYISVRDQQSAAYLQKIGIGQERIHVVPDPVMGFVLPEQVQNHVEHHHGEDRSLAQNEAEKVKPVVGVSVRFWNEDRSELLSLAKGLSKLTTEMDVTLKFLPFYFPGDDEASRFVIKHMEHGAEVASVIGECEHPSEMVEEVKKCDLLIGMRLHSLIYAASQGTPMIGISYDPKIDQFLARLNISPVGSHKALDGDQVAITAASILKAREAWLQEHMEYMEVMRRDARVPAHQITQFLKGRG
ncbi:polysaccharide pyruvyl transferase CsaB [Paenibacillus turicensis]|uniref:polysaccharide pyruvyl transferase CsaB n=1 Tax=Paenibacillus turicensis TaxID=160487 RepID=UPI003D2CF1DC